jgi:DNA polymerase alpha-associated DNA helicase A
MRRVWIKNACGYLAVVWDMNELRSKYLDHLLMSLRKEMEQQEKETPATVLKCRLLMSERMGNMHKYVMRVHSISREVKLGELLSEEDKVYVKSDGGSTNCTIVSVDDREIGMVGHRKLGGYSFDVVTDRKHNNEILLGKLERFIEDEREFNEAILKAWNAGLKNDKEENGEKESCVQDEGGMHFHDQSLNESQKRAVLELGKESPYKILGPPGTGKTRTIVEIITQLLSLGKEVLVCGPSNISVDNIIKRFMRTQYFASHQPSFYRLGSSVKGLAEYNLEAMTEEHTSFMEREKNDKDFCRDKRAKQKRFVREKKDSSKVVFSTLFSSLKEDRRFDWVIVDEACQGSEIETFLAVVKGRSFVLAGDPNQLCPDTSSLYESMALPVVLLNEQYRMCEALIRFSNRMFYENKIVTVEDAEPIFSGKPIIFVDTEYFEMGETAGDPSKANLGEAMIVKEIVEHLKGEEIGVIAPYTSQVLLLQKMVDVEVSTVDGFQGQERDIIVLTLVRSNGRGEIGFLSDRRRLNVAITRCRKGLVVVGDPGDFRGSEFFNEFFAHLETHSLYLNPMELKMYLSTTSRDRAG